MPILAPIVPAVRPPPSFVCHAGFSLNKTVVRRFSTICKSQETSKQDSTDASSSRTSSSGILRYPEVVSVDPVALEEAVAEAADLQEKSAASSASTSASDPDAKKGTDASAVANLVSAINGATPSSETRVSEAGSTPKGEPDFFASQELVEELKDSTQLGKRGEAWFFAQIAALALIVFPPVPLVGLIDLVGTLALTSGLVFIGYGLLSLGRNLSPMPTPRKTHTLVTSGMYSYVRHPMYGGSLLAALGLAAVTRSEPRLALAALLWYILEQKVKYEERALLERYGAEYEQYKAKVKKFIPYVY
mmetsp:Transcript_12694/g.27501  ORF Transcript_12694/g.27501 Transcript_12694/m.27501 type:complete len:304 (+) Transcript_12694:94-1005(+)